MLNILLFSYEQNCTSLTRFTNYYFSSQKKGEDKPSKKAESNAKKKPETLDLGEDSLYRSNVEETSKRLSIYSDSEYFDDSVSNDSNFPKAVKQVNYI